MSDQARASLRDWLGITALEDATTEHRQRIRTLEIGLDLTNADLVRTNAYLAHAHTTLANHETLLQKLEADVQTIRGAIGGQPAGPATGEGPGPEPTPPTHPTSFSDGQTNGDLYGLTGNEAFNPAAPTLKNGTTITSGTDLHKYWQAATNGILNATATSGNWVYVNIAWALGRADVYDSARHGQAAQCTLTDVFRLTGDLRLLDRLVEGWNAAKTRATTAWAGHSCASLTTTNSWMSCPPTTGNAWSPYTKFLDFQTGWSKGTDLQYQNVNKHAAMMVEAAWAFHLNRGKASPAGYDYGAEADYWGARVEDFVKTWSQTHESGTWTTNYRGDEYTSSARRRAPYGVYPLVFRNGGHVALQAAPFHHYLGLLGKHAGLTIPNPDDALAWVTTFLQDVRANLVACTSTWGASLVMRGRLVKVGSNTSVHGGTYTNYTAAMWNQLWFTGRYRSVVTREDHRRLALAWADMHYADGRIKPDLLGGVSACGLVSTATADRTQLQQAQSGYAKMLTFEDRLTTTRLRDAAVVVQEGVAGGWVTPDSAHLPAALFARAALDSVGDLD